MSQGQRAVIALFACLVIWLAAQSRMSWQHPILPSGEYPHQQSAASATGGENQPQNLNWNNWTRDPIAVFTSLLTLFNGLLFVSTIGLWLATRKSASISERALTELEQPVIGVKIIRPGLQWDELKKSVTFGPLEYSFVNHGRTPATLYELFDDVRYIKIGEGYPPNVRAQRGPPMPYGVFIPPSGESRTFSFPIFAHMIGIVAEEGGEGFKSRIPFFLGTARYGDIFGNLYTMGFCFMFDDVGNRFIEAGGPDHSYCHKERGPYRPPGIGARKSQKPT